MLSFVRNHKVISIVIVANLVVVVALAIAFIIHNSKTATIDILVAPENATIEINGKTYENYQSYDLAPGDYTAVISMEYMQTREVSFTLNDGDFYRLHTYLLSADGSFAYYEQAPNDAQILIKVSDENSADYVASYQKRYSIVDKLPIYFDDYRDNYTFYTQYSIEHDTEIYCPKIVCIKIIDRTENSDQLMLNKIRELGYNPDDYEIDYIYEPFSSVKIGE